MNYVSSRESSITCDLYHLEPHRRTYQFIPSYFGRSDNSRLSLTSSPARQTVNSSCSTQHQACTIPWRNSRLGIPACNDSTSWHGEIRATRSPLQRLLWATVATLDWVAELCLVCVSSSSRARSKQKFAPTPRASQQQPKSRGSTPQSSAKSSTDIIPPQIQCLASDGICDGIDDSADL